MQFQHFCIRNRTILSLLYSSLRPQHIIQSLVTIKIKSQNELLNLCIYRIDDNPIPIQIVFFFNAIFRSTWFDLFALEKIKANVCIVERIFGPINSIFNKQRTPMNSKLIVFSMNNKLEWQHTNGLAKKQHKTYTHMRTQRQQQHKTFQTGLKRMKFAI